VLLLGETSRILGQWFQKKAICLQGCPFFFFPLQAVILAHPTLRDTFLVADGAGGWRVPRVNETCCKRPALAQLLRDGEA
jgi:hypothetical protein